MPQLLFKVSNEIHNMIRKERENGHTLSTKKLDDLKNGDAKLKLGWIDFGLRSMKGGIPRSVSVKRTLPSLFAPIPISVSSSILLEIIKHLFGIYVEFYNSWEEKVWTLLLHDRVRVLSSRIRIIQMDNEFEDRQAETVSDMIPSNQQRKKQSFLWQFLAMRERNGRTMESGCIDSLGEFHGNSFWFQLNRDTLSDSSIEKRGSEPSMSSTEAIQNFSVFAATWNVGGQCPTGNLDLSDFLQVRNEPDMYVLGFQEIVPLNAGNVLVLEDNEPAAKWLALINQSLNGPSDLASKGLKPTASFGGSLFFQKPSLKKIKKTFKKVNGKRLKSCNCVLEMERKAAKDFCFRCQESNFNSDDSSTEEEDDSFPIPVALATNQMKYSLVASKQMVGIFVSVWMRKELVQYVGHLRICCTSRGIMGCLGNKWKTVFKMKVLVTIYITMFLMWMQGRIIWFGDLNYRISLSHDDAKRLVEKKDWPALFNKDQSSIECIDALTSNQQSPQQLQEGINIEILQLTVKKSLKVLDSVKKQNVAFRIQIYENVIEMLLPTSVLSDIAEVHQSLDSACLYAEVIEA
ncbi:hypothetical protein VNO77_39195 [Canavalia gladiata]|uniref:Inositol polyphosphate-related phosphatase domain-containing protein n=1 Tax=Canavalia gladiata TaxID=3824 RepID=A0AAN9KC53_CANGL